MSKQNNMNQNSQDRAKEDKNKCFCHGKKLPIMLIILYLICIASYFSIDFNNYLFIPKEAKSNKETSLTQTTQGNATSKLLLLNATGGSKRTPPLFINIKVYELTAKELYLEDTKNDANNSLTLFNTEQSSTLLKTTNNTALNEINQNSLNENKENTVALENRDDDATNDLIINPTLIQRARDIIVSMLITAVFVGLYFPLKKAQRDKRKFRVTLFIITISLITIISLGFLWYAIIWFPDTSKRVEAFSGLMSTFAFLGLIVTIFFQIKHHKEIVDMQVKFFKETQSMNNASRWAMITKK